MNTLLLAIPILGFLAITPLHGQSGPGEEFLLNSPPEKLIPYLKSVSSGTIQIQLIQAAIQARRNDLVEILFRTPGYLVLTAREIAAMQYSDYRDQLVLMMLKTDSPYWPDKYEPHSPDYSGPDVFSYFAPPYTDLLAKHLPDRQFTWEVIKTHKNRREIAAEVEAVMAKTRADESPAPDSSDAEIPVPPPPPSKVNLTKIAASGEDDPLQKTPEFDIRLAAWSAGLILAAGLIVLAIRKRSS